MASGLIDGVRRALELALALALLLAALPAAAQFRVEVTGIGLTQLPVAIAFRGEDQLQQKVSTIVQADLERSGQFRAVDSGAVAIDETSRLDLAPWRQKGADSLAVGSVARLADGRFDIRFRLWDVVRGQDLGGLSYAVPQADLRLVRTRSPTSWSRSSRARRACSRPALPT